MAEAIAKKLAGDKAEIKSAGTEAFPGSPAARVAIEAARPEVDMTQHRSQKLTAELVTWADIIYVPTLRRDWQVRSMFSNAQAKIVHLDGLTAPIPDPIGADAQTYAELYGRLKSVISQRFIELGLL